MRFDEIYPHIEEEMDFWSYSDEEQDLLLEAMKEDPEIDPESLRILKKAKDAASGKIRRLTFQTCQKKNS